MKKIVFLLTIIAFTTISCDSATYDEISDDTKITEKITYEKHVKSIMTSKCTSCHSSNGTASFLQLNNYEQVSEAVDDIIDRIQLPVGDPLRMPQGGTMSTTDINIILKWKQDGLLQN